MRPAVKASSPVFDCATTLRLRSMGHSATAQTPKRKCARRDPVRVRIPGTTLTSTVYSECLLDAANLASAVDGKWSSWVSWGACSVSCGGGTRQRTRLCASPAPQYAGRQCEGNDVHIDFCNSEPCPGESFGNRYVLLYFCLYYKHFYFLTALYFY